MRFHCIHSAIKDVCLSSYYHHSESRKDRSAALCLFRTICVEMPCVSFRSRCNRCMSTADTSRKGGGGGGAGADADV